MIDISLPINNRYVYMSAFININHKVEYSHGKILGYAYASAYSVREAYNWTVKVSIYLDKDCRRKGIGTALYVKLKKKLSEQGIVNTLAGVAYVDKEKEKIDHILLLENITKDDSVLMQFYENAVSCGRLPDIGHDKFTIIERLGLVNGKQLTNAGRVLFSKNKPLTLKMAVFATEHKDTFLDISRIEGNIFVLINAAMSYIVKKYTLDWLVFFWVY